MKVEKIWLDNKPTLVCFDMECEMRRPNDPETVHCEHRLCEYRNQYKDRQCYNFACSKHPRQSGSLSNSCELMECLDRQTSLTLEVQANAVVAPFVLVKRSEKDREEYLAAHPTRISLAIDGNKDE